MLDTFTLRFAFGLIAACVLALFYVATYRTTRSPFSGWWVLSLVAFLSSAVLFLLNGTSVQWISNPAGNMFGVAGSACVWAAASSLRDWQPPRRWLLGLPLLVLVFSLLDDPAHDVWAGGSVFLAAMSIDFVLGTWELLLLWRARPGDRNDSTYTAALLSMAVSSGLLAVFYFLRLCVFTTLGPDSYLFTHWVGAQTTTLLLMVLLVVVTFNMSALAHFQLTRDLEVAASRDPLTGLLNRSAFEASVPDFVRRSGSVTPPGFVVMADFDDFKLLNDHYGHAGGDEALVAFAAACRAELAAGDVAARLGGDEFAMLLANRAGGSVERTLEAIGRRLGAGTSGAGGGRTAHPAASVSFGVAELDPEAGLDAALARADAALYRAKRSGFGLVVRAD